MDAARYMGETDIDKIMSWTPAEYLLLRKGFQHRRIDEYEFMAKTAMAIGYANNSKKAKEHRIFNAAKARRLLEKGITEEQEKKRMVELNDAFKGFTPQFRKKGGH